MASLDAHTDAKPIIQKEPIMTAQTNEIIDSISSTIATYYWQLAVVVIAIIILIVLFRRRQPSSVPAFETESGSVRVARSAIVELVRTACEQIRGVRSPRIRLKLHKDALDVVIRIKLASDCQLATFSKTLQDHLKRSLQQNLGIRNLRQVNLIVTGFRSAEVKAENLSPVKPQPSGTPTSSSATSNSPTLARTAPAPSSPKPDDATRGNP
jgi:uncharacterized alkaline shock family protein YloU